MTSENEIRALAKRFFDAVEAGDVDTVRASYTDDCPIWHNTDSIEQTPDDNANTLRGMTQRISERNYSDRRLETFPGGFVQQHVLKGVRKDGSRVEMPVCIVCRVRDGKISRLDEYFDSVHVAEFRKVFA